MMPFSCKDINRPFYLVPNKPKKNQSNDNAIISRAIKHAKKRMSAGCGLPRMKGRLNKAGP